MNSSLIEPRSKQRQFQQRNRKKGKKRKKREKNVAKGMWNVYEQPQRATKEKTTSYGGAGVEGIQSRGGRKRERGVSDERGGEKKNGTIPGRKSQRGGIN